MRSVFYPQLVNGPFGDPALYVRLAHRGQALLFDCGELHALTTRELLKVGSVFISHAHIDHLIGIDHLLRTFLYQDRCLDIYGPAGLAGQIEARLSGYTWNLVEGYPFVLRVREWRPGVIREVRFRAAGRFRPEAERCWSQADGTLLATPDFTVRAVPLAHGAIVSLAFVLEETLHVAIHKNALAAHGYLPGSWLTEFKDQLRRNAADDTAFNVPLGVGGCTAVTLGQLRSTIAHCEPGMKLAYVTDVSPTADNCQQIRKLAQAAHLLVIEAVFTHADLSRAQQRHHLTAHLAGALGRAAGAQKLLVFHHSPRYLESPTLLREEADAVYRGEEKGPAVCSLQ